MAVCGCLKSIKTPCKAYFFVKYFFFKGLCPDDLTQFLNCYGRGGNKLTVCNMMKSNPLWAAAVFPDKIGCVLSIFYGFIIKIGLKMLKIA